MMGIKNRQFSVLPDLSLKDLVPNDHLYRRLEKTLDFLFVRELVRPLYAGGGRPSVDPVVFFKLQLVMFFENPTSGLREDGSACPPRSLRCRATRSPRLSSRLAAPPRWHGRVS